MNECTLILNGHHKTLITDGLLLSKREILLSSAIIKDFLIPLGNDKKTVRFSKLVKILAKRGIVFKIITTPRMKAFYFFNNLKDFDNNYVDFRFCARMHMKLLVIDTLLAYVGSANFTGAGFGMKGENKRNFEAGMIITNREMILQLKRDFQEIWSGARCTSCKLYNTMCEGIQ